MDVPKIETGNRFGGPFYVLAFLLFFPSFPLNQIPDPFFFSFLDLAEGSWSIDFRMLSLNSRQEIVTPHAE